MVTKVSSAAAVDVAVDGDTTTTTTATTTARARAHQMIVLMRLKMLLLIAFASNIVNMFVAELMLSAIMTLIFTTADVNVSVVDAVSLFVVVLLAGFNQSCGHLFYFLRPLPVLLVMLAWSRCATCTPLPLPSPF